MSSHCPKVSETPLLPSNTITFHPVNLEDVIPGEAVRDTSLVDEPPGHPIILDALDVCGGLLASSTNGKHLFAIAILFSVALHAVVLSALGGHGETQIGGLGVDIEAVSVEVSLVQATAVESLAPQPVVAPGSTSPVEIVEGAAATPERIVPESKQSEEKPPEEKAELSLPPTLAPEPVPIPAREELERQPSDDPVKPKREQAAPTAPTAPVGGAAARAIDDKVPSMQGAAAARPGEVQRYARSVVEALSGSRPKGLSGTKGTAKISFQISPDGSVVFVRIIASSGNPKLDAAAMAAVETVRFPPPPSAMTAAQLTYEIPYHFR